MFGDTDTARPFEAKAGQGNNPDMGVQALYQAATRLADARRGAPRFKTRDLVGLLLSHGARTWRNSQPRVGIRIKAVSPEGRSAVRLAL